jgi:hypothetical protein
MATTNKYSPEVGEGDEASELAFLDGGDIFDCARRAVYKRACQLGGL